MYHWGEVLHCSALSSLKKLAGFVDVDTKLIEKKMFLNLMHHKGGNCKLLYLTIIRLLPWEICELAMTT